jgi:hypothetical protein
VFSRSWSTGGFTKGHPFLATQADPPLMGGIDGQLVERLGRRIEERYPKPSRPGEHRLLPRESILGLKRSGVWTGGSLWTSGRQARGMRGKNGNKDQKDDKDKKRLMGNTDAAALPQSRMRETQRGGMSF